MIWGLFVKILFMSSNQYYLTGIDNIIKEHVSNISTVNYSYSLAGIFEQNNLDGINVVITDLYGIDETINDTIKFLDRIRNLHPDIKIVFSSNGALDYSNFLGISVNKTFIKTMNINESVIALRYIAAFFIEFKTPKKIISTAERKIINLYLQGIRASEISLLLGISIKSVYCYKRNVLHKLGIKNKNYLSLLLKNNLML